MKRIFILLMLTIAGISTYAQKAQPNATKTKLSKVQVQYACPMHTDVVSNEPGKCPKCNMDLTMSKKEHLEKGNITTYRCPMHAEVVSDHAGTCAKCSKALVIDRKGSKQGNHRYTCTMHPQVQSSKPGKCPICNMDLAEVKTKVNPKKN